MHLTETCDEELPHLITHVETTLATSYDVAIYCLLLLYLSLREVLSRLKAGSFY